MNRLSAPVDVKAIEESAEELYEHAPCGYISALPNGAIIRANQTFLTWTGYARDAVVGRRLRDLLTPPGRMFYETHYDPLLRMQGFVREMALDLVCASGRQLPALVTSVQHQDSAGHPTVVRTMVFDATERRIYERELLAARRRAEQLAAVVEASADAIIIVSAELTVQTWNAGAERLFGYSTDEALGRQVRDLIVPPTYVPEFEEAIRSVHAGRTVQLETVRVHKSGARMDVSLGLTPHFELPGELVSISAIIRDITERRRTEQRLHQAEQLESIATLAGGVAHEVNNQMAVVLGFGDFVLKGLGSGHVQAPDVRRIITAAAKAAGISQQLLAFSRQLPFVRREVVLSRLVQEIVPKLEQLLTSRQVLVIRAEETETLVYADPTGVERVISELVENGCDAMTEEGQLTVSVERAELTEADARLRPGEDVQPGHYVVLSVADTGSGMDRPTAARAFEPFFTTKPFGEGIGLGLAMVHGIVKQHGGYVWVTSEPDRGTVVRVYLPAVQSSHGAASLPDQTEPA